MPEPGLLFPLDLLHGRAGLPLPRVERVDGALVPEPCRRLLVHESDMTPTLAAFHGQEIGLRVLGRRIDGETLFREVVLLAESEPVEFGAIAIHLGRFAPEPRAAIEAGILPLGTILAKHSVVHTSRPQAFVKVTSDDYIHSALGLSGGPHVLYGRRNILANEAGVLADILEILPHGI